MASRDARPLKTKLLAAMSHVALLSFFSAFLLFLSHPPCGWSPLAFVALVPWLMVVSNARPLTRRDYLGLWLTSGLFWLAMLHGIRLANPLLYPGWIALAFYVAIYVPLFVVTARLLVGKYRLPLAIAAPMAWISGELVRAYFLTGFAGCMLSHTQLDWPAFVQLADQLGGYGVSAVVVLCNVAVYQLATTILSPKKPLLISLSSCGLIIVLVLGYGRNRLASSGAAGVNDKPLIRAALVQENTPTIFESIIQRSLDSWRNYVLQTALAGKTHGELDLIMWPESTFSRATESGPESWVEIATKSTLPKILADQDVQLEDVVHHSQRSTDMQSLKALVILAAARGESFRIDPDTGFLGVDIEKSSTGHTRPYLLVGGDYHKITPSRYEIYNAAIWFGPRGDTLGLYQKQHLVVFGEFIPFASWLPWLNQLVGMAPVYAGKQFRAFHIDNVSLGPSICFENMVPHLIQRQVNRLTRDGQNLDILANVTNDGWFHGSSMLDHHLACARMASIENRRPMLIAGNTGFSAWIDGCGRLKAVSRRYQPDIVLAEPTRDSRWGAWQSIGDWPARIIAGICLSAWIVVAVNRYLNGPRSGAA